MSQYPGHGIPVPKRDVHSKDPVITIEDIPGNGETHALIAVNVKISITTEARGFFHPVIAEICLHTVVFIELNGE